MPLNPDEIVEAFVVAGRLAGLTLASSDLRTEVLSAPHRRPSSMPAGTQAIYAFLFGESCLKVGKAGPKTRPGSQVSTTAPALRAPSRSRSSRTGIQSYGWWPHTISAKR